MFGGGGGGRRKLIIPCLGRDMPHVSELQFIFMFCLNVHIHYK